MAALPAVLWVAWACRPAVRGSQAWAPWVPWAHPAVHPLARPPQVNPGLQVHSLVDRAAKAALLLLAVKPVARVALKAVDRAAHPVVVAKLAQAVQRLPKRVARHPCAVASQPIRHRLLRVPMG